MFTDVYVTATLSLHTGEGDRFGEAVHHIDVYAFDSLGIYRKMFRDKGAHLKNGY
ncbi:FimB/Mfa2 family fimbrial subunit, partial [Bacteroides fragilis]